MEIFTIIDILGTAAFAASGVLAALEKKLDIFGIFIIAFITAFGGGTLRDVLIGDVPVGWMLYPRSGVIILITVALVIAFKTAIKNFQKTLLFFDAVGLGFFTILGIHKGLAFQLHPGICIALGTITGCFGGVIRDISLNTIPLIFHREVYATACILGGLAYFLFLYLNIPVVINEIICILIIVLVRLVAVRNNWSLPRV